MQKHAESKSHQLALTLLASRLVDRADVDSGPLVTGATDTVPRVDRFVMALNCIVKHASYRDYESFVSSMSVGSILPQGGALSDTSAHAIRKMTFAMAEPLRERDRLVLRDAAHIALGCDERDSIILVHLRVLTHSTKRPGWRSPSLYECVLGPCRDFGTGWEACLKGLRLVLRDACTVRQGRRDESSDSIGGVSDVVDEELYRHVCHSVKVAVADGAGDVQKALFEASSLGGSVDPLFPNVKMATRDRAHRLRSVQKGTWGAVQDLVDGMLSSLITGEKGLAVMLVTSRKFSLAWETSERVACDRP